ncbi:MAG: hypothetical protein JXL97_20310 [Bacteroidales bacterium]|nr:hypothetical protein [Bacteroidales bacterium]
MKSGKCPKCGSENVYFKENPFPIEEARIRLSPLNTSSFDYCVCVDCGYMEYYISNPKKLNKIEKQWEKVSEIDQSRYI